MNVCLAQCLVLPLGTRPDVIETTDLRLENGNRNTGLRSLIVSRRHRRHRRQRHVQGPKRQSSSPSTEPGCSSKSTEKRALRPNPKDRTSVGYARCSVHSCRRHVRDICRRRHCQPASASIKTRMRRSTNG